MNVNPFSYLIEKLKSKVDKSGDTMSGTLKIDQQNGTISTEGYSYIHLGNSTPTGTDKNSTGSIRLFASSGKYANIVAGNLTANRAIAFPDNGGTVALTSDITTNSSSITSKNATYINSIWLTCLQLGTLVIVSGSIRPEAVYTPTGSQLISGLPTAKNNGVATAVSGNGDCYKISIAANTDYIRKDENATPVSTWYNLLLVYEAK